MASPDFSGSCMIALYPSPDVAKAHAVPGGLPADEMHLTVVYCGDTVDVDRQTLVDVAGRLARRAPIEAALAGHGRFTGGDSDVAVLLVDSPQIEVLRRDAVAALAAADVLAPDEHGFTAHMTLTYLDPDEPSPVERVPAQPVTFAAVTVMHGEDRTDIPFRDTDPLGEAAREAYAAGWALSSGPLTDRVRAGCEAAVAYAHDRATEPDVLEVALQLGKLEGTWAAVFDRREALHAQVDADALTLWRDMFGQLDQAHTVAAIRRILHVAEATTATDRKRRQEQIIAAVAALLLLVRRSADWQKLVTLIAAALASAHLHGWDAAHAIAADQAGVAVGDLDNTTPAGLDPDGAAAAAVRILDAALSATAWRAARRFASDDYLPDELDADLSDQLDDGTDLSLAVDTALSAAYTGAMVAGFLRQNVRLLNYLTAGDTKVCPVCDDNEAGSPYTPASFPALPAHPGCRCVPAPA